MSYKEVWQRYIAEGQFNPEQRLEIERTEKLRDMVESGQMNGYTLLKKWCIKANGEPMYLARFDCGEEVGEMQLVISQQAWENLNSDTIG